MAPERGRVSDKGGPVVSLRHEESLWSAVEQFVDFCRQRTATEIILRALQNIRQREHPLHRSLGINLPEFISDVRVKKDLAVHVLRTLNKIERRRSSWLNGQCYPTYNYDID